LRTGTILFRLFGLISLIIVYYC